MENIIHKIKYWQQTSIFKTIFYNIKYGVLKNKQLIIYPKTKLLIDATAHVDLGMGHLVCNLSHYEKRFRSHYCVLQLKKNASFSLIANNFTLCEGSSICVRENASLVIEGKGFLNTNSTIDCYERIEIGEGTIIASNVSISDSDTHYIIDNGVQKNKTRPIKIGKNVWICRNAIILKGVTIGNNSIIAASSVITKDVPSNCIVAGNPAKVIRENCNWEF